MDDPALRFASDHLYFHKVLRKHEDLLAFSCWRYSLDQSKECAPTADECISRIMNTLYNDPMDMDYLMKILDNPKPAYLLLGEHRGFGYRLKPFPNVLKARFELPKEPPNDTRKVLPHMYLGLNKTREFQNQEHGASRRDSVLSNGRTNDDTGFTFFQLGLLEYADYQQWALRKEGLHPAETDWQYTNYVVVVQLNEKSQAEDVWIVCYYRPEVHIVLGRPTPNKNDEYDLLDLLPSDRTHGKRRPAARIAKNFKDLRENTVIKFPDPGTNDVIGPFELVPAVFESRGDDQVIVRQYIKEVKSKAAAGENEEPVADAQGKKGGKAQQGENRAPKTNITAAEVKIQQASDKA